MTIRNAETMGDYNSTWQIAGYAGQGNVEELIGTLRGRVAIVAGSGHDVMNELKIVGPEDVIFAVNDIGMFLPRVDHWISLHGGHLNAWKAVRWLQQRDREFTKYHSVDQFGNIDYVWEQLTPCFALSGYFAMQIAYIMGADQIILCGCPGDASRRFTDIFPKTNHAYEGEGVKHQLIHEMKRLPEFKEKVRSTSGWTKEFFGGL